MTGNNIPSMSIPFQQISNLTQGTKMAEMDTKRKIASH
jgi:hypothetical protein